MEIWGPGRAETALGRWRYYLTAEKLAEAGAVWESYGVLLVDGRTGERAQARHVTVSLRRAVELLDALARGGVTPVTLGDVIQDWLP